MLLTLKHVNMIELQPLQAGLDGVEDMLQKMVSATRRAGIMDHEPCG